MGQDASKVILEAKELAALYARLASEIKEREVSSEPYHLVGIHTRGIPIAQRLAKLLGRTPEEIGTLDINLYRDDLSQASELPVVKETKLPFAIDGARILLIDDVLYTGRTIRSALDALTDLGRPKAIALLVLIDRGERELPIQPDFCGKNVNVQPSENVKVRLVETDGIDRIEVIDRPK